MQEALRLSLEAYYEPRFRRQSHGFRPGRGCHTALADINGQFTGPTWFIEGDIRGCFDDIEHEVLMDILSRDIHDGRLLNLIRQMPQSRVCRGLAATTTPTVEPRKAGYSVPLLRTSTCMNWTRSLKTSLFPSTLAGAKRAIIRSISDFTSRIRRARQRGDRTARPGSMQRRLTNCPLRIPRDPNYRRLSYIRYADDFMLGFIGPKVRSDGDQG